MSMSDTERLALTANDSTSRRTSPWTRMLIQSQSTRDVSQEDSKLASFASMASWAVNWFLLGAKMFLFIATFSKSVLASLADSAVDLVSQAVLSLADRYISKHNPDYPVGRSRLEALSVLACASIMIMVSIEVIQFSIEAISNGINGNVPIIEANFVVYTLLSLCMILKLGLNVFCAWAAKILDSDSLRALAEDHINDVFSNAAAIIGVTVTAEISSMWWFDPSFAIFISVVIIYRWCVVMQEQVQLFLHIFIEPKCNHKQIS